MKLNSLKIKLLVAFVLCSLSAVGVGYAGLTSLKEVSALLDKTTTTDVPALTSLAKVRFNFTMLCWAINKSIAAHELKDEHQVVVALELRNQAEENLKTAVEDISKLSQGHEEALRSYQKSMDQWTALNTKVWSALERSDTQTAWKLLQEMSPLTKEVQDELGSMLRVFMDESNTTRETAEAVEASAVRNVYATALCALLFAVGVGITLTVSIVRAVSQVQRAAERIALGDINQKVEYRGGDEVGALAESFRSLLAYIASIAGATDRLAKGDLSVAIQKR